MAQHAFSPDKDGSMSPLAWYQASSQKDGFIHDPVQETAVGLLDTLWQQLVDFKAKRNRFLGRSLRSPEVPQGLYFWGGVGRGKSFLMDAFFTCVPYRRKRRVHFHHFMAEVHNQLRSLSKETDPLVTVAARIAQATRLLCFDEFHVSDIADAMILSRLLSELFRHGVIMVLTSNYPPDQLYPNGLQRNNFLPAIELLKQHLTVFNLDGGNDYRLRELTREPLFMVPAGADSDARMEAMFDRLTAGAQESPHQIEIQGRKLMVKRHAPGVIWFDFATLCGGPRSQTDYLDIAGGYHTVFVSGIPKLSANDASPARRLTWLVDVFYDHRVKLVASCAVDIDDIYTEGVQASEFFRTASRLTEMQSSSYLELPHLVDNFKLESLQSIAL
ncbi:cell division protein ZapE [Pseudogulbenkiania subflava]|uniref:Cell division protein ZapE n=1 Tax=Pseudogulbenkiania subflava DSM 22618 TaxID=1123014 RepID=A0A1Y6BX07_9NEIS|nr:cell division protein ZapE [Pseudogulbenkiania subflava]SMF31737.1 cell division protein ZapE [Pseudogulbenkiania subflava DSM 22618]